MASVNKVIILGNLGRDPEIRTAGSSSVCSLSVATSRSYKDKAGEVKEETEWHRVSVWGNQGENCAKYLAKGRSVYVEGRIQTRKYTDKDGVEKYATGIVADTVQFLGGKGERGNERAPKPSASNADQYAGDAHDDIPF